MKKDIKSDKLALSVLGFTVAGVLAATIFAVKSVFTDPGKQAANE